MASPNPRLGSSKGDSLLSALEREAREHRASFTGKRPSTLTMMPPPPTRAPAESLFDALEDDARELREEDVQRRPATFNTSESFRKQPAMASVYGQSNISLPGDLGPADPRRAVQPDQKPRTSARSLSPRGVTATKSLQMRRRMSNAEGKAGQLVRSSNQAPDGGVRLRKDYDAEPGSSSSDDEGEETGIDSGAETDRSNDRGRARARVGKSIGLADESEDDFPVRRRKASTTTTTNDDLADPKITVTPPSANTAHSTHKEHGHRSDVHPSTAFDTAPSGNSSPVHSDDEHLSDLRRAQKLSLTISPIHSTPSAHRVIRQIIRGDYGHFQREAEEGRRRQRVYLVATDLSSEAEYALEWTIGTVLRDGDTLLAVYAVDEEGGNVGGSEGVEIGHGADVVKETASIVRSLTFDETTQTAGGAGPRDNSTSRVAYGEKDGMNKSERERFRAAEDISQRCVRLLRKTRLQVRVVVEVFHCKSPRHMITEVVSFLGS